MRCLDYSFGRWAPRETGQSQEQHFRFGCVISNANAFGARRNRFEFDASTEDDGPAPFDTIRFSGRFDSAVYECPAAYLIRVSFEVCTCLTRSNHRFMSADFVVSRPRARFNDRFPVDSQHMVEIPIQVSHDKPFVVQLQMGTEARSRRAMSRALTASCFTERLPPSNRTTAPQTGNASLACASSGTLRCTIWFAGMRTPPSQTSRS